MFSVNIYIYIYLQCISPSVYIFQITALAIPEGGVTHMEDSPSVCMSSEMQVIGLTGERKYAVPPSLRDSLCFLFAFFLSGAQYIRVFYG